MLLAAFQPSHKAVGDIFGKDLEEPVVTPIASDVQKSRGQTDLGEPQLLDYP